MVGTILVYSVVRRNSEGAISSFRISKYDPALAPAGGLLLCKRHGRDCRMAIGGKTANSGLLKA